MVTITVNGKKLTAPAGSLLIDVCRQNGIEIPAFCYYPGLSLQAACRMCVVRQEKVPKLQTACTTQIAEGQVFVTESEEIAQARKSTIELLLGNHPLDCPVCDAGGECELQDMTFKYGAGESLYSEAKRHREEQKWSPAVYYDRPRCILCYRCIRMCGEGMDVWALGVQNRGASAVIAPNGGDHLDCEQCGMCIDVCPVGALTSGSYRYKSRPWEMNHVSTVCTHCADGCKVTLGVTQSNDAAEILRADNRDKSGMNGDFLCAKGRFGFDFVASDERIAKPLVRNAEGKLEPATWEVALRRAAEGLLAAKNAAKTIGVVGSNQATNEESYLLQKLARTVLATNSIDHERSADYATFVRALAGNQDKAASLTETAKAPAILLIGGNPTEEHPLVAWNLRTAVRIYRSRLYIVNDRAIKLERQAKAVERIDRSGYASIASLLASGSEFSQKIAAEESVLVIFGNELTGAAIESLVAWGLGRPNVRFAALGQTVNGRGAADMGVLPDLLPGYVPVADAGAFATEYPHLPTQPGLDLAGMVAAAQSGSLGALLAIGANPLKQTTAAGTFIVVADTFLTETAQQANVVLPAASLYEKSGTVTNAFGDVQRVQKAADRAGIKDELEILVRLAGLMGVDVKSLVPFGNSSVTVDFGQTRGAQAGEADRHAVWLAARGLEPKVSPFDPLAVLDEIERLVAGYTLDRLNLLGGNAAQTEPGLVPVSAIKPAAAKLALGPDGLFVAAAPSALLAEIGQHQAALVK